jgi:FKBP-type peptidyl-prolyl cis-trans isomerase FklB
MNKILTAVLTTIIAFQIQTGLGQAVLTNDLDSLSYAIGVNIGQSLRSQNVSPNTELLKSAINDILAGGSLAISESESSAFIQNYFQKAASVVGNANLKAGNDFLVKNNLKAGVITTESGLQYEILTAGTGAKPISTDKVKVHYHGTLIDGTIFDSSVDRGTPATFGVTQVISGWVEGLQLMPMGSKYKFVIPAELAYGSNGQGKIGPNATLVFEVELIEIIK